MIPNVPCVVLTGGIASGKTTVSEILSARGIPIIDTDVIAHQLTQKGEPGYEAVVKQWGNSILKEAEDGSEPVIDRKRLRQLVFSNAEEREKLEAILHPMIMLRVSQKLKALENNAPPPYAVVVIPLYAEKPLAIEPDAVVVVDVSRQQQVERLLRRDNIDEALAEQILNAQSTRDQRLKMATDVLHNETDEKALMDNTLRLHDNLVERFNARESS